ncbi:MAG TPA: FAD-dependent monooxygenase [Ktedonobacteraceae bacterium]|nr:FAD-dependent monooxygenase [Ktedonobacteraceae bacterium]
MKNNKVFKQKRFDTHHAIVIGGSMAGLLAARVLSDHFEQVTIIERDQLIEEAQPRKGVPQGRHVHALLAGGAAILGTYFPDLFASLARDGAVPVGTADIRRYQLGVRVAAVPGPIKSLWQSRPFLEQHVRACLAARTNVQILDSCSVTRLRTEEERITGVVLQRRGQQHEEDLAADLVVDASGRGSRAPQWLAALGYGQVEETSVTIDVGYASRIYRCPDHPPTAWKVLIVLGPAPDYKRAGVIFPIEGGDWMVTLGGWLRDYPPDDDAGFLDYARGLSQPDLYEAIKQAEPLTPIALYKYSANRWRHYERLSRLPEGFIVIGDAVCAFSPVYGQGMSVAAMEAKALDTCLREQQSRAGTLHSTSFPQRFHQAIAKNIKAAWMLSTGEDLRYPETQGHRSLGTRLFTWYIRRVVGLTASRPQVAAAFFQVWHLLNPLRSLFEPRIFLAVLGRELLFSRQKPGVVRPPDVPSSPGPVPPLEEAMR